MSYIKEFFIYILVLAILFRDSFSDWTIWESVPAKPFYIVVIVLLLVLFYPTKKVSLMQNFWMQLRVILLILAAIIVMPLAGGHSEIGLDIRQPIFFMIIVLSFVQLSMQHKRAKQQVAREKEIEEQLKKQQAK